MAVNNSPENQALALAGIFQATSLCKNLATFGRCDSAELAVLLGSILKLEATSVTDVYGSIESMRPGLQVLQSQLNPVNRERDLDLSRYAIALIQLGTNMQSHRNTMNQIQRGIAHAKTLDFDIDDPTMINNLAEIYRQNISHLSPRIMISGEPAHLDREEIAAKIRATLLAGLRSVILWRQCKGTRPGLIFNRGKYLKAAEYLLNPRA